MSRKAELLEAIAGKNRGLLANEIDNVRVLSAIQQLEDINPTKKPLEAKDLLDGGDYSSAVNKIGVYCTPLAKVFWV